MNVITQIWSSKLTAKNKCAANFPLSYHTDIKAMEDRQTLLF